MKLRDVLLSLLMFFWISGVSANTPSQVPDPASVESLLQRQRETAKPVDQEPLVDSTEQSTPDPWPRTWKEKHAKAFLVWAGESEMEFRWRIGFRVMFFLILFFFLAHALKHAFWKEIDKNKIHQNILNNPDNMSLS